MRRLTFIILGGMLLTGCAASRPAAQQADLQPVEYIPATAPILAFDPQITVPAGGARVIPMISLSREDREVTAEGGLSAANVEYYDVQTDDDQQFYNYPSTYERRVLSDRV